jgi:ubiquinone/menaquinone biosynthesis C-methylase UbiE
MSYFFAEIYDEIYQKYKDYYLLVSDIIKKLAPPKTKILDLGCGTGILEMYLPKDCKIVGIDNSKDMLKIARSKKLKNVKFVLADIRNFNLKERFDIAVCINDTLNHLTSSKDLKSFFSNIARHLKKGSIFIFDFNITNFIKNLQKENEANWIVVESKDKKKMLVYKKFRRGKLVVWKFIYFYKNKNNKLSFKEEEIFERVYDLKKIEKLMKKFGFKTIEKRKIGNYKILLVASKDLF